MRTIMIVVGMLAAVSIWLHVSVFSFNVGAAAISYICFHFSACKSCNTEVNVPIVMSSRLYIPIFTFMLVKIVTKGQQLYHVPVFLLIEIVMQKY